MGCVTSVANAELGVMEYCGAFWYIAKPGPVFLVPIVCSKRGTLILRTQQLNVEVDTKTLDNVFTTVTVAIQYRVIDDSNKSYDGDAMKENSSCYKAFYKLNDQREQMRSFVFDTVRAKVPAMLLDDVFESKDDIAISVKNSLKNEMKEYGYEIQQCLVVDVLPDLKVKNAMNEINTAKRLRAAAQERAEGEKTIAVTRANAEAIAKAMSGQGISKQRAAIIRGLKISVADMSQAISGQTPKEVMELVLLTQYFDTLEAIGKNSNANTLFLAHNPGALANLSKELTSFTGKN